jgi:hypothetical protein
MKRWLMVNKSKRKKNTERFIINWLERAKRNNSGKKPTFEQSMQQLGQQYENAVQASNNKALGHDDGQVRGEVDGWD